MQTQLRMLRQRISGSGILQRQWVSVDCYRETRRSLSSAEGSSLQSHGVAATGQMWPPQHEEGCSGSIKHFSYFTTKEGHTLIKPGLNIFEMLGNRVLAFTLPAPFPPLKEYGYWEIYSHIDSSHICLFLRQDLER